MDRYAETIAIDGPAGSGKSTVGSKLAEKLGYVFVDAGLLYRAITLQSINQGIDVQDVAVVTSLARELTVDISSHHSGRKQMLIHGRPVESQVYDEAISKIVPIVAAYGTVRAEVRRIQADIARQRHIVFAGRDIGTVVLPNAELKIFLQASLEERATRRYLNLAPHNPVSRERVMEDLRARDTQDSTRAESPLRPADDAIILHTDTMSIDTVMERVLHHALKKNRGADQCASIHLNEAGL